VVPPGFGPSASNLNRPIIDRNIDLSVTYGSCETIHCAKLPEREEVMTAIRSRHYQDVAARAGYRIVPIG
jgi:hypothetical protein